MYPFIFFTHEMYPFIKMYQFTLKKCMHSSLVKKYRMSFHEFNSIDMNII